MAIAPRPRAPRSRARRPRRRRGRPRPGTRARPRPPPSRRRGRSGAGRPSRRPPSPSRPRRCRGRGPPPRGGRLEGVAAVQAREGGLDDLLRQAEEEEEERRAGIGGIICRLGIPRRPARPTLLGMAQGGLRGRGSGASTSARPTAGRPGRPSASRSGPRGRGRARSRRGASRRRCTRGPGTVSPSRASGKAATACRRARRASPKSSLAWSHAAADVSAGRGQPSSSGSVSTCSPAEPAARHVLVDRRVQQQLPDGRRAGDRARRRLRGAGRRQKIAERGAPPRVAALERSAAAGPRSGPFRSWRPPPCCAQLGATAAVSLHRSGVPPFGRPGRVESAPMADTPLTIVGAGVVGLAVAARLAPRFPEHGRPGAPGAPRDGDLEPQQRGHPRRDVLPGRHAQGAAVRPGEAPALRAVRAAGGPPPADHQAHRGHGARRDGRARAAPRPRPRQRRGAHDADRGGVPPPRAGGPRGGRPPLADDGHRERARPHGRAPPRGAAPRRDPAAARRARGGRAARPRLPARDPHPRRASSRSRASAS